MISLPGLTLSTGRFEDARKILAAFAKNVSMGMLPNRFQDNNEPPEYNTVDGTLWYFIAIKRYLDYSGDLDFILKDLLPVLKDIIDWHFRGTRFNIHVGNDGLLFAGETGQQLTWMDARIGDWVVTPRMGKPVEIQALWYNSLLIFADLLDKNKQQEDANLVRLSASKCKASFIKNFWYREGTYLYDNIDQNDNADPTLRPNQLFAISLPYPLVEGNAARSIIKVIEDQLYTPVGLRTLSISHPSEGTVWSWLLGPYIDAIVRTGTYNEETEDVDLSVRKATAIIKAFRYHLKESAIGSVSEIFDAVTPHHPRGCVAQAWGVAEILRVIKEYGLKV
jgi:predicted glycogen debranching enzyme